MSSFGQYLVSGNARASGRSVSAEDRVGAALADAAPARYTVLPTLLQLASAGGTA